MKKVITFFGAESKVGTTMLAQSVAEELAARKKSCLLIFASSEMYDNYLKEDNSIVSLDNLSDINPENLKLQDVKKVITKANGLEYIKGSNKPLKIRYFSEKLIPKIVKLAPYDYIVVDGGHNYHFPLPVSSLLAATDMYYVLTQNAKAVNRFKDTISLILNAPALKTVAEKTIIVNKHSKEGVYTPEMISEITGLAYLAVPRVPNAKTCEINQHTLNRMSKPYKTSIASMVDNIVGGGSNE